MKRTDEELMKIAQKRVEFKKHLLIYLLINLGLWIFWFVTSPNSYTWPLWVSIGWGIGIISHYSKAYVKITGQVQKEFEKLKKEEDRK